jgi:type I restriction enzyme S subunit
MRTARLSEIVLTMRNGTTAEQNLEGRGYPVTRIESIANGVLDDTRMRYVELADEDLEKWRLKEGDVLLSHINSEEHIGKSAIYTGSPSILVHGMNLLLLRPDRSQVLPEYLHLALRSPASRRYIRSRCKRAVNQASINQKELGSLVVPVPDLDEQRRVVDVLSGAEGIVRLRRKGQARADAIMPALFLDMFGDPSTNPMGWPAAMLAEVVDIRSGATPSKQRADFWTGDLAWVSPKDMKTDVLHRSADRLNPSVLVETNLKLVPSAAVLIVVRGMILAHTVPVALTAIPLTINQDIKALIPGADVEGPYLLWALKVMHKRLLGMVSTAAHGTKKLDTNRLETISLPLPPLVQQREFARRAESLLSVSALQNTALSTAEKTFQSLMSRAFTTSLHPAVEAAH